MKRLLGDYVHKLYARYHDPSSNGAPDILFTRLLYLTKYQSRKRVIIKSNIYRILPKDNQVIYALDAICEPNIMILAQAVLDIFCVECLSQIIQSMFHRISCLSGHLHHVPKLYAWYHDPSSNGSPDILFTMLLYYTKMAKSEKEDNLVKYLQNFAKS